MLVGGNVNDALSGDAGNDILQGGLGADNLIGGTGIDFASYADATGAVRADLNNAASNTGAYAAGDTYFSDDPALLIEGSDRLSPTIPSSAPSLTIPSSVAPKTMNSVRLAGNGYIYRAELGADQLIGGLAFDFVELCELNRWRDSEFGLGGPACRNRRSGWGQLRPASKA